jgi:hypothetical protein
MKYIILKSETITQDMLDSINGKEVTVPTNIALVEADLESGTSRVDSDYFYITTNESFPNLFSGYKKLSKEDFDSQVTRIRSGQTVQNKVEDTEPVVNSPFANKEVDGKKIYKRIHGVEKELTESEVNIDLVIPYTQCKITGLEIVGSEIGDKVDFLILDTDEGLISGVPNYPLNQFGFNVFLSKDYYEHMSNYDADLVGGMVVRVTYKKISSSDKTVYLNVILHEVK